MPNIYAKLLSMIPSTPRQVGEVISINGSRVRVDLVGGGVCTCQGDAQVGGMVYVEGDQIIGEAPSLPVVMIEV